MSEFSSLPPLGASLRDPSPSRAGSAAGSRPTSAASSSARFSMKLRKSASFERNLHSGMNFRPQTGPAVPFTAMSTDSGLSARYTLFHSARSRRPLGSAECIKCMLQVPHKKCEAHKYIRVGGGYRHSYSYLKSIIGDLEFEWQQDAMARERLEAIKEAYKTTELSDMRKNDSRCEDHSADSALGSESSSRYSEDDISNTLPLVDLCTTPHPSDDEETNPAAASSDQELEPDNNSVLLNGGLVIENVTLTTEQHQLHKQAMLNGLPSSIPTPRSLTSSSRRIDRLQLNSGSSRALSPSRYNTPSSPFHQQNSDEEHFRGLPYYERARAPDHGHDDNQAVKAVKTYIRTKSGRLLERVIFLSEEDYNKFIEGGGDASEVLKKYLTKDEAENLDSWDKEEVKAIKTFVRTKSGRLVEKLVYVSKTDYNKIKAGDMDASDVTNILKKYVKTEDGERIDGWGEAQMKTVKTMVRTKSGRMIEKTIMVSKEEYEELQRIAKEGGDPSTVLGKYMSKDEKVEGWKKVTETKPMKVVKTMVRTKSGRMVEKTIMLTEDEYKAFQESGGDKSFLKKFLKLEKGEEIESWEKASTVYGADSDDEVIQATAVGKRIVGEDGNVYEVVVDPITGKKYKKKLGKASEMDDLADVLAGGKVTKGGKGGGKKGKKGKGRGGKGGDDDDEPMYDSDGNVVPSKAEIKKYKALKEGKRNKDSDSDFSYRSVRSAGGTRKVLRRRRKKDGTYSAEHSYHSEEDEEGKARRRKRRRERKHPDSAHSYYSVVSAGGTRKVRRRKKNADGTYGSDESYHSEDSIRMKKAVKKHKKKRHGSGSEYSYFSDVSAGGTRTQKRKKRIRDKHGRVIGHAAAEKYSESSGFDSDSSYESFVDASGRRVVRKKPSKRERKGGKGKDKDGQRQKLGKTRKDYGGGFSDNSTDTDDEPDLENMTEAEKKEYFAKKAARKAARDQRRREKYGDKYEEIMSQHNQNKKQLRKERALLEGMDWDSDEYEKDPEGFKQKYKSMVTYEKGADRGLGARGKTDGGAIGMGHESWGGRKGGRKGVKDGHEADSESEDDGKGGRRKKKKGKGQYDADDESSDAETFIDADGKKKRRSKKGKEEIVESDFEYEIEYDEHGRVKKKKKKYHDGESGSEYEFEYDAFGNLIGKKKTKAGKESRKHRTRKESPDDGNYFEKGPDGQIRLRAGKNKIDISKLTNDDLRALGIDPNMSKQDIARALKAKFGDSINITKGGQKVGLKGVDDYGSDANTDDLADDSDLDTSTLKPGRRRVQILMKKGGSVILEYMKKLVEDSNLVDKPMPPEVDATIDYLQAYRLVDNKKIDGYARAFVVEDEDKSGVITYKDARVALEGVNGVSNMTKNQLNYVMKVLDVDENTQFSFRMFGVAVALCERVTKMDSYCKNLLEICNLADIERKLALYQAMFHCNASGDRDPNYIKCESLMIELIAGGLSWPQQDYVMSQLEPNEWREISFIDYLVYIPLFLSMHDGICTNPLDMSLSKYTPGHAVYEQRDTNPLGYPLKQQSAYSMRQRAEDLLAGKIPDKEQARKDNVELLNKYAKLPDIIGQMEKRPPGAPRYL